MLDNVHEQQRKIILDVIPLFLKYGLKSVTMDDVARHLGMSKKTLYNYFRNKDDLVLKFTTGFLETQREEIGKIYTDQNDAIQEIIKLSEYMKDRVFCVSPAVIYDLNKYFPASWKQFVDHKERYLVEQIERTIVRGIEQGYFRKEINVKILSKARVLDIESSFNTDIYPTDKFSISEVHIELFEFFFYGISTLKGHKAMNKYKNLEEE